MEALLRAISLAIALSQPAMSEDVSDKYAKIIVNECKKAHIEPFLVVALVDEESKWRVNAVSLDGEDYGLGGLRARFESGCRNDLNPVQEPSESCQLAKARLLDGAYNLKRTIQGLKNNEVTCRIHLNKKPTETGLLASYGGLNKPAQAIWCGEQKRKDKWQRLQVDRRIRAILAYRAKLQHLYLSHKLSQQLQQQHRRRQFYGAGDSTARLHQEK